MLEQPFASSLEVGTLAKKRGSERNIMTRTDSPHNSHVTPTKRINKFDKPYLNQNAAIIFNNRRCSVIGNNWNPAVLIIKSRLFDPETKNKRIVISAPTHGSSRRPLLGK